MVGKVLKPIPGTGYGIGDMASHFDDERFKELVKGGYIETAVIHQKETASIEPGKHKVKPPVKDK